MKMKILTPNDWTDYQLLDSGDGQRLEKFGQYTLVRPDPQIIWKPHLPKSEWEKANAVFEKNLPAGSQASGDKGKWNIKTKLPDRWLMSFEDLKFYIKLSPFKHTGVFPEQAVHWEFIFNVIASEVKQSKQPNILNLFGYTGIASLVALKAGAKVTHVDASFPTIGWFQDNLKASNLEDSSIRWIEDDVVKFCERELKRGNKYDGIIMDPPVYGHGPNGEIWDINKSFPKLMEICSQLLSEKPLFVIVNAYAISTSAITLENVLKDYLNKLDGNIESGELALKEQNSDRLLSTGIFARWSKS